MMNTEYNNNWTKDVLGEGFTKRHIVQPDDYAGRVRCTVIRHKASENTHCGALYIHGFSDYFFQKEMAIRFNEHGYNFYAVDLRKYGRSLMKGQKMFQVRDLREYFQDIQAGIDAMKEDGNSEIVLIGHSTGGLTTSLYMQCLPDPAVKALILNSPFLAWNLPSVMKKFGIPIIKLLATSFPNMKVKGDRSTKYAASIAEHLGGEWIYNTAWKPDVMPDVDAAWIKAIDDGQKALYNGHIDVPVLLLHSDKSAKQGDSAELCKKSDAVLDVKSIAEVGRKLGSTVYEIEITDGLHDLILSRCDVRNTVYNTIFNWLDIVL